LTSKAEPGSSTSASASGSGGDTGAVPSRYDDLLETAFAAFNRAGAPGLLPLTHPDIEVFIQDDLPNGGRWDGHEGWLAMGRAWQEAWERFTVEPLEVEDHGARTLIRVRQRGRARGSGIEVDGEFWYVAEVRDGRISLWHLYTDRARAEASADG
jgi:ketosteroid isomerase-like protein